MNVIKYVFLFCAVLISGCSSSHQVQSSYSDKIIIDGVNDEWGSNLNYLKGENVAFGFVNNNEFLYVSLVTSDRSAIRKIIVNGLTLWLSSSKGKIGIIYPFKLDPSEFRETMILKQPGDLKNDNSVMAELLRGNEDLQVINETDLPLYTFRADAGEEFKGKINITNEKLVYEMQIPIRGNEITGRVFDENINEAELIFQTGKPDRENMRGSRPPMGGMNDRGSRGAGGRGGMHPPGDKMDINPLEYSFQVKLNK